MRASRPARRAWPGMGPAAQSMAGGLGLSGQVCFRKVDHGGADVLMTQEALSSRGDDGRRKAIVGVDEA